MDQSNFLRVVIAVRELAPIDHFLGEYLGLRTILRTKVNHSLCSLYGLSNGDLLVLSSDGGAHSFGPMGDESAQILAVGVSSKHRRASANPLKLELGFLLRSGLHILIGEDLDFVAVDPAAPFAIDHVAAAVYDEADAANEFQSCMQGSAWNAGWQFPEVDSISHCVRFGTAYVELCRGMSKAGLFSTWSRGPRYVFCCLRPNGPIEAALGPLQADFSPVGRKMVRGVDPDSTQLTDVGLVHHFNRQALSGLPLMIVVPSARWNPSLDPAENPSWSTP